MRTAVIAAAGMALLCWASPPAHAAEDCNRACLRAMLDHYLAAVTTHNPAAAPLFAGFRQTENAVVVRLGNGVWKTVTGLGKVQRRYLDAVSGQAAYYGIVEEGAFRRARFEESALPEAGGRSHGYRTRVASRAPPSSQAETARPRTSVIRGGSGHDDQHPPTRHGSIRQHAMPH